MHTLGKRLPACLIFVVACGADVTAPVPVATVVVSPPQAEIDEGQALQLAVVVRSAGGETLSQRTVTWASSDTAVVAVTSTGLLTARRDGQATLTVSSEGKSVAVPVNVIGRAATITLTSTTANLNEGDTVQVNAVVTSQRGTVLTRRPLVWSSSDPAIADIATPSATGARAKGTGHGIAVIRATLDGVAATLSLSVRGNVARVELSRSRLDFVAGQSAAITARTWSSNNVLLTDRPITTINSAADVATIDGAFTATAVVPGTALITVRSEQATATLTVVVHRILLGEIGWYHTCAIVEDIATYCWGQNDSGELGNGSTVSTRTPSRVISSVRFVSLIAQYGATIGRTAAGEYYAWGASYGTPSNVPVRAPQMSGMTGLVAGANFICGLALGATYCWGNNQSGQLGTGSFDPIFTTSPGLPVAGPSFTTLFTSSTAQHTCATQASGAAWCWGINVLGGLGDLTVTPRAAPVPVVGGFAYTALATSNFFTCGQTTKLELRCWGGGDGTWMPTSVPSPRLITSGINFVRLTAGIWHACGLTANGDAYCWGTSPSGALGNGTTLSRSVPTRVSVGRQWVAIAAGGDRTCGVTDNGRMYCWGTNAYGELGTGSLATMSVQPVEVAWPSLQ